MLTFVSTLSAMYFVCVFNTANNLNSLISQLNTYLKQFVILNFICIDKMIYLVTLSCQKCLFRCMLLKIHLKNDIV